MSWLQRLVGMVKKAVTSANKPPSIVPPGYINIVQPPRYHFHGLPTNPNDWFRRQYLHGRSQGFCETTSTERFFNSHCVCPTYPDNLGPCGKFEAGSNGRCVYCDHTEQCDKAMAPWASGELGRVQTVVIDDEQGAGAL